jgi:AAA+ ATPase superfamily predicted ATPase
MVIGRKKEQSELRSAHDSEYSEFVAVYGRRRVGKTFLIRETFDYKFTFSHAGVANGNKQVQLAAWRQSLEESGMPIDKTPRDWMEAFGLLRTLIKNSKDVRKVIFIDEMPWMDTQGAHFVSALEFFWNAFCSARKDVLLIICGSATSWIINKIFKNHGGLYNRITYRVYLEPFTLHECEQYSEALHLKLTHYDLLEGYMVMGGIPYYWSLQDKGKSLAGNIDDLFFSQKGKLCNEFNALYHSLFRQPEVYIKIVSLLGNHKNGLTRLEIIEGAKIQDNGSTSRVLEELEQCDFIRRYNNYGKKKNDPIFQLIDNFTLFYFKFMQENKSNDEHFWSNVYNTSIRHSWTGLAFERICFQHVPQIKQALGIAGVMTNTLGFKSNGDKESKGVQIDMLIDRADNVINLCEMKFSQEVFTIDKDYEQQLRHKIGRFCELTNTRKAVHLTMVTMYGVEHNAYWNIVQKEVTAEDLFKEF